MNVSITLRYAASLLFGTALVFAQATPGQGTAPAKPADPAKPEREPGLYVTITTSMGTIVGKLYEKQ